ncbi:MAG: formate dehydrogenase accessory sulfurtransferase FdhD [Actinomycetota bacterium]
MLRSDGTSAPRSDLLATEEPLEIRAQYRGAEHVIAVTMRTPGNDFDLAVGFLHSEGMVRESNHVVRVSYCASAPKEQIYNIATVELSAEAPFDPSVLKRNTTMTSACGVCGKASIESVHVHGLPPLESGPIVAREVLLSLPSAMRSQQRVFAKTGGLHAASLFDESGRLELLREDVGRHNAVDKLIGSRLLSGDVPLSKSILLVSGRASFEIVQKAALAGIPIVAAVSAPSSLAVSLAEECGMTLCGFLREESFSVYSGRSRIKEGR